MQKMIILPLPDSLEGTKFEEYVSAVFQSIGYYTERNIEEKEVTEQGVTQILELDIILTDYSQLSLPNPRIIEVKSGGWGFPDIFKLYGWMNYLGITRGIFVVNKIKSNIAFCKRKSKEMNIDLIPIPELNESEKILFPYTNGNNVNKVDISIWRFSNRVESTLLKYLTNKKNSEKEKKCFKELDTYNFEINSKIFFINDRVKRLIELYDAFKKFYHISAKCGNEIVGNSFDENYNSLPSEIFRETYVDCKYNAIQISTFIEHRARLAILKNAVDYKLNEKFGGLNDKTNNNNEFLFESLPENFKEGLNSISEEKYFYRYPVFWQWFMWVFGGFILNDYEEKEYELLSNKTGIPEEEIPNALAVYQKLFPTNRGWFLDLPNSNIRILKMFSVPFMGIGADYRRLLYTKSRKLQDLNLTGTNTLNDLVKWNNLTAKILEGNISHDKNSSYTPDNYKIEEIRPEDYFYYVDE